MRTQRFEAVVAAGPGGRAVIVVPFDPDEAWGVKAVHHVNGTVGGSRVRTTLEPGEDGWAFSYGPARAQELGIAAGDKVAVELTPEGPQRGDLAEDIAAALAANPAAGAFFDTLAQFYRKGYLRYIDATTRRPDLRAARIAEVVDLLTAGVKERPRGLPGLRVTSIGNKEPHALVAPTAIMLRVQFLTAVRSGDHIMTVASVPPETYVAPKTDVPPETEPPVSLRERKKQATRRLLRRAALGLVAERGLANVTVEDIAEAAEVSPRTFFNYFPSKEAALFGGDPDRAAELRERVVSEAPGKPALVALAAVLVRDAETVTGELRSLGGDPAVWLRRMKAARTDPHVRAAHAAQMAMLERAIGEGLATRLGTDQETDPYPGVLAAAGVAVVRSCLAFWAGAGGAVPLGQLIEQAFLALGDGLPENTALRQITERKDRH